MYEFTKKLISIASPSLGGADVQLTGKVKDSSGNLATELEEFLKQKNGFFAFESALHMFPSGMSEGMNIENWNSEKLWISEYGSLVGNAVFFAEDIFGHQFCIYEDQICSFDPETGELEHIAESFEGWARVIIEDYNLWTGCSIAHDWQAMNGPIPINSRLIPKIPFVCGGDFNIENLAVINSVSGMKSRANLANQIANLEDGTQIEFKIVE